MATHYIENASSGSQYYFNANNAATTTSQSYQNYTSPRTTSDYSIYPGGSSSPQQQIRLERNTYNQNDLYQLPQQHQSKAGFNKNVSQQYYQPPQSPLPQVRATVRTVGNQPVQLSPQQHHFQFDSRQQPGHSTGPPVVYQTPGAAQFTHHNVDLWTENPSQGRDHLVQAQRVSVRSVSTGSPQQSYSIPPSQHQDPLQQYYNQLTPEQHQQLLRQQQLQRQQQQDSRYEQQRHTTIQQSSPPHQEQYRSVASVGGGVQQLRPQQVSPIQIQRGRLESDRQRQDEQDFYAAQRQMAAQRATQQPEEEFSHPVGIRGLMNKFAGPTPSQKYQPRSKSSTSSRHYSASSYTSNSGPGQTTSRTSTTHSMTYSALPKPREPPVNSIEYYQMQQQGGNLFSNIQQAAAPAHIQHTATGVDSLRDRYKTGSFSESRMPSRQQPPQQQQQQQQQQTNAGGNTLLSLRNQYMNRAKESAQNEFLAQQVQNISRTIVGEDIPRQQQQAPRQQQQQQASGQQIPRQEQEEEQLQQAPASQIYQQEQQQPPQNESVDQPEASSEVASPPTNDTTPAEPAASSN